MSVFLFGHLPHLPAMRFAALVTLAASFARAIPTNDAFPLHPSHETARRNAHPIFNEIHSAARQWGSSLNHNGMGFIPAVVPRGTLLHHGSHQKATPKGPEWLAFEVEHAENFANSRRKRNPKDGDEDEDDLQVTGWNQKPLQAHERPSLAHMRGYLHTYQAIRDLNLLYLDGLAAAKTGMGTLDAQDFVLRTGAEGGEHWDELQRAEDLCDTVTPWGYDGLIRTEVGFEVIHCNFTDSLELVSQTRTMIGEDKMTEHGLWHYHFARAASRRYDGIGAGRIKLDYSSMISGFFFPINISSQTPGRPELLRFASAKPGELAALRLTIGEIAVQPRRYTVDWQAVVDQVVTRFADRFTLLTAKEGVTDETFRDEFESMALTYYDASPLPNDEDMNYDLEDDDGRRRREAAERCSRHFLLPALVFREEFSTWDELISTAVGEVTRTICETTQNAWMQLNRTIHSSAAANEGGQRGGLTSHELLRRTDATKLRQGVQLARSVIQDLMDRLGWTIWKKTLPCPPDSFLYVAMWPFGTSRDHWDPGCRSVEHLQREENWFGYWRDHRH